MSTKPFSSDRQQSWFMDYKPMVKWDQIYFEQQFTRKIDHWIFNHRVVLYCIIYYQEQYDS